MGFLAQLLGGSVGMGYGVTASTGMLLMGFSPASASSVIHLVEIGTSLFNGTVHWRAGNVSWRAVAQIGIPGAIGALCGALLVSSLNFEVTKMWVAVILLILGSHLVWRFVRNVSTLPVRSTRAAWMVPLGLTSGFVDASTGGGWGVMTTSTLVASGSMRPSMGVGTSSTARFLVALAGTAGFFIGLGVNGIDWLAVVALVVGGLISLPFIGFVVRHVSQRALGIVMGVVLISLNVRPLCHVAGFDAVTTVVAMLALPAAVVGLAFVAKRVRQN